MKRLKDDKLRNEFYCNGINKKNEVVCEKRLPELRYRIQAKEFVLYCADKKGQKKSYTFKSLQELYDLVTQDEALEFVLKRFFVKEGTLEKAVSKAKGLLRKKHSKVHTYVAPKVIGVSLEPKYKGRYKTSEDLKKERLTRAQHNKKVAIKKGPDYLADYLEEDRRVWIMKGGSKFNYDEERKEQAVREFEKGVALLDNIK